MCCAHHNNCLESWFQWEGRRIAKTMTVLAEELVDVVQFLVVVYPLCFNIKDKQQHAANVTV